MQCVKLFFVFFADKKRPVTRREKRVTVLCLLEKDLKKHIWIILVWTLIENILQFLFYVNMWYFFHYWFQILLLAGDIVTFLQIACDIWQKILNVHIGLNPAISSSLVGVVDCKVDC